MTDNGEKLPASPGSAIGMHGDLSLHVPRDEHRFAVKVSLAGPFNTRVGEERPSGEKPRPPSSRAQKQGPKT